MQLILAVLSASAGLWILVEFWPSEAVRREIPEWARHVGPMYAIAVLLVVDALYSMS
jgi:hypothetical protein